jgi:hypothetical protein
MSASVRPVAGGDDVEQGGCGVVVCHPEPVAVGDLVVYPGERAFGGTGDQGTGLSVTTRRDVPVLDVGGNRLLAALAPHPGAGQAVAAERPT